MIYGVEEGAGHLSYADKVVKNNPDFFVYQDEAVVVVNKPAGIYTSGASEKSPFGISELVQQLLGPDICPVHQLDGDTTGAVLLGKGRGNRGALSVQFRDRTIRKGYVALVDGEWDPRVTGIIAPLTPFIRSVRVRVEISQIAKQAVTAFQRIALLEDERGRLRSLLWVRIFTGRTHQIRAHLQSLGFPITGDQTYNDHDRIGFSRQLLYAYELTFCHPQSQEIITLNVPLVPDFHKFVSEMRIIEDSEMFDRVMSK